MNKLKNKVFYTIFVILSLSLISFIIVFNVQNYLEQEKIIQRSLDSFIMDERHADALPPVFERKQEDNTLVTKEHRPFDENIRFMDANVYTVMLASKDEIIKIISHSSYEVDESIKN